MCLNVYASDMRHLEQNRQQYEGAIYYKVFRIYEEPVFKKMVREISCGNRTHLKKLIYEFANPPSVKQILPVYFGDLILIPTFTRYRSKRFRVGQYHFNEINNLMPTNIQQDPNAPDTALRYGRGYHAYTASHFYKLRTEMRLKYHWNVGTEYPVLIGYSFSYNYFFTILPVELSSITAVGRLPNDNEKSRNAVVGRTMLILDADNFARHLNRQFGNFITDSSLIETFVSNN